MATQSPSIEHVVVLMLENRSFDHMLGRLPGVNGILGPGGKVNPAYGNLLDPATPVVVDAPPVPVPSQLADR